LKCPELRGPLGDVGKTYQRLSVRVAWGARLHSASLGPL